MNDLAGLTISTHEFELLAAYCATDGQFPTNWATWADLISRANAYALDAGFEYEPLHVNPTLFRAWCVRVEVVPCLDSLRAYAIFQRAESAGSHFGFLPLGSQPGEHSA